MKKITAFMLLAAFTATAQSQPNVRLTQLEEYLATQNIVLNKWQSNNAGKIRYSIGTDLQMAHGWEGYFRKELTEEERQQRVLTVNSRITQERQHMEGVIDYFRTTFASLGKEAPESYLYEFHKNGMDTIKYSYSGPSYEGANFKYTNRPYKNNDNGILDYCDYSYSYFHYYYVPTGISEDNMKAFDGKAFCEHIHPVLQKFMKLKGAKAYPVHWQHDEGFDKKGDFEFQNYRIKHAGLSSGTHYIIPSEHEGTAKILFKQLDSLAYDYLTKHPEQPYEYKFRKGGFVESTMSHGYGGLPENVIGNTLNGSDEFYLCCKREQDGLYHILTLNSKGVHWVPRDWASLKSYINGEKVYIKGMEPKEEKK